MEQDTRKQESRERAVRRIAKRRGYTASLSRTRDPLARDYQRWHVTGPEGGRISPARGWTLEQAERWLATMGGEPGGGR
jgi:hypothetical protein